MATYVLTIAGATKSIAPGSLSITETLNGRATLECAIDSLDGSYRPALDAEVILTEDGTRIFGGLITRPAESGFGGSSGASAITTRISAVDFNALADRRHVIAGGFPPGFTLKAALTSLVGYLTAYGVALHAGQVTGPTLPLLIYDVKSLTASFDELSAITGYVWRIDFEKKLRMFAPGSEAAPFNIAQGASGNAIGDVTVEPTRTEYANQIILLAGTGEHDVEDVIGTGDGSTTTFSLNYPLVSSRGYVTVNGVNETLGTGATWTYDATTNTATRTPAPAAGHAIVMPYTAQFPIRVQSPTSPPATPWEKLITAPDVFVKATAQALADGYLARATAAPKIVTYLTRGLGLHPGQTQTIASSRRNIASGTYLIRDVKTSSGAGNVLDRHVTAIQGTVIQTNPTRDTLKQWSAGSGARSAAVVAGTVTPSEGGFFPDDVTANTGKGLPVNESALTNFLNSQLAGAAHRLGKVGDVTTWYAVADDLHALPFPVPRLAWVSPARLNAAKFHAALQIPIGTNDTAYLIPDGGGGGALYIGAPTGVFGPGYRATNVYAIDGDFSAGIFERGRAARIGEWEDWTPTWTNVTVGNGTLTAKYSRMGTTAFVDLAFQLGSTSAITGNPVFSLPVNNAAFTVRRAGDVYMFDTSAGFVYEGVIQLVSASTAALNNRTGGLLSNVSGTSPFTWATGDRLHIQMMYRTP
jgi:hypothetical protein